MKKTITLIAVLLALLPGVLTAQTAKKNASAPVQAILAFSDDETQLVITDAKGNPLVPGDGLVLPPGSIVKTLKTTAEIQLKPNGTIIKLAASTTFKIEALKAADGTGTNDFAILGGKIRAVAAKLTGASGTPGYNVRTPTANCGVRGTDFAMKFDPDNQMDWVCVQEGQVDFTNIVTGDTVPVGMNEFANTFDPVFQAGPVDAARLAQLFSDLDFVKLNPLEVNPKEVPETANEVAPAPAPAAEEKPAAPPAEPNPVYEFLKKFFGLEVGSVTIDGNTYSKAVLSPVIAFDSFKLGLYLPIVYTRDMFDPNDWYRPAGNNEWSFGSDKTNLTDQISDAASDLALKIKYLEWGTQGVDPFYLKVGNLKTMSLGHGTVVRNFANDQDFPAIRKVGLNAGAKLGGITFEGMADDLAKASVVGGRIALDAVGDQVVVGFQAAADLHLANDQDMANDSTFTSNNTVQSRGDPILMVGGVDLQLFQVNLGPVFRTKAFADVNTLALYNRSASAYGAQGFNTKTLWHDDQLGSLGGEAGFFGNIAIVDYRLTFQAERGLYKNGLFQGNYYRTRNELLTAVGAYTLDSATAKKVDENLTMGIFGSAGFNLFGMLTMEAAYRYPMVLNSAGSVGFDENGDYFKLRFDVPKDKIPFVKLSGGVGYERNKFVKAIAKGGNLLDADSVLRGEVVYGMVQGMDLVVGLSTSALRDSNGNVVYDGGKPKVGPTISIDTKVSL